ncbi:hypothetical protein HMPREF9120_01506 [Neisseria sp. oral taxon 020 str. F0370]|nr:hypothetical protein HMPREF9120_01506 [Neisseria sp. oral taxon 020 str. F0370]
MARAFAEGFGRAAFYYISGRLKTALRAAAVCCRRELCFQTALKAV